MLDLVRGQTPNIIVELGKIRKVQDKMKYLLSKIFPHNFSSHPKALKHTKDDPKLMLWLLTPLNLKMVS